MGAGKTTIGQKLSEILKLSFIDVDQYIEKKYETDIPTIFKTYGEEKFREYEMISLKELTKYAIVATGGGIVEKKENIQLMKKGVTIYLYASLSEIKKRLKHETNRPLWNQTQKEVENLYERRHKMYEKCADIIVNTNGKSVNRVTERVKNILLHKYPKIEA